MFKIICEQIGCRYTIRQGHLSFAHHDALREVSFTVSDGEKLGVIGLNGSGKSTLLRILAGVLHPTSGQVIRHGEPNCSLLCLNNQWYPDLSGRDNAVLACLMSGMRRAEAEQRVEQIREFSQLEHWLDMPVRTYSSGMSQRLALAAALQVQPEVLLLDETLGVGDILFQKKASAAILATVERAKSMVLVSHSLEAVVSMCNRIIWLENGRLRADGPMEEIMTEYQSWLQTTSEVRDIISPA